MYGNKEDYWSLYDCEPAVTAEGAQKPFGSEYLDYEEGRRIVLTLRCVHKSLIVAPCNRHTLVENYSQAVICLRVQNHPIVGFCDRGPKDLDHLGRLGAPCMAPCTGAVSLVAQNVVLSQTASGLKRFVKNELPILRTPPSVHPP